MTPSNPEPVSSEEDADIIESEDPESSVTEKRIEETVSERESS